MLSEKRMKLSELVGQPETQAETPSSRAAMLSVLRPQLSELAEPPCVFVWTLAVFGELPSTWRRMLHPFRRMPYSFGGQLCQHRRLLHEIEGSPLKKHGQLYLKKGMPCANLGTLFLNLGTLSRCARTLRKGEDAIREESRNPRAVLPVPARSRKRRHRRAERPSPHKATLRVHLRAPSTGLETPGKQRTMPTVKLRSSCRLPQSLQRFLLEELATFTKKGTFNRHALASSLLYGRSRWP
jgi:hypothetical protein